MQTRYHRDDVAEARISKLKADQLVAMVKGGYLFVGEGQ